MNLHRAWRNVDFSLFAGRRVQHHRKWVAVWQRPRPDHHPDAREEQTFALPTAHHARRLAKSAPEGWSGHVVAPLLWRWPLKHTRLPIYGENEADRLVRELWDDPRFGAFVFRKMAWPPYEYSDGGVRMNAGLVGELWDLIDHIEDPYTMSANEVPLDLLRAHYEDGALEDWCEECEGECDCGRGPIERLRSFALPYAALGNLDSRSSAAFWDGVREWLKEQVKLHLGIRLKPLSPHQCRVGFLSYLPPDEPGVYVLGGVNQTFKIGKAKISVARRMREVQCGHPEKLRYHGRLSTNPKDESFWHKRLARLRLHGEWFRGGPELTEAMREARP